MSESATAIARGKRLNTLSRLQTTLARSGARHVVYPVTGIAVLLGLWWLGGPATLSQSHDALLFRTRARADVPGAVHDARRR